MRETEFCILEIDGPILWMTINRPTSRNSVHPPASHEFAQVFRDFESNPELRVAIITGQGDDAFCAGNDVKFSAKATLEEMRLPKEGFGGISAFYDRTKPIISAVNGFAYGGGFEIALATDIIIASDTARFALPEPKIGLAALGGGIHRLSRQIPYKKAVEMILTGRNVGAREGEKLGFVNTVTTPDALLETAKETALVIAANAPTSIAISMQGLSEGGKCADLAETRKIDHKLAMEIVQSLDFREGVSAFSEKRKPNWPGYKKP